MKKNNPEEYRLSDETVAGWLCGFICAATHSEGFPPYLRPDDAARIMEDAQAIYLRTRFVSAETRKLVTMFAANLHAQAMEHNKTVEF